MNIKTCQKCRHNFCWHIHDHLVFLYHLRPLTTFVINFSRSSYTSDDGNDDKDDVAAAFQNVYATFEDHQCQIVLAVLTEFFRVDF